jgi:hypothetical protein
MTVLVSNIEKLFSWDCGQLIVILSCIRLMKNSIFVDQKHETVHALKPLLTQHTQWCNYFDDVMKIITMSSQDHQENNNK